jgi:deoxyribodipyrimidine photo-lyase
MALAFAPKDRLALARPEPVRPDGDFVLYWMRMSRRTRWNFALQQALAHAEALGKPLVVMEGLRRDLPYSSPRFHQVLLEGMQDQAAAFGEHPGVRYWPMPDREPGDHSRLLQALSLRACVTVTDAFPHHVLPAMLQQATPKLAGRLEVIDTLGLLPLSCSGAFATAHAFRRHLHKHLAPHLMAFPHPEPLKAAQLPSANTLDLGELLAKHPPACLADWLKPGAFPELPFDSPRVLPVPGVLGGGRAASQQAQHFLAHKLARYQEDRNDPSRSGASGLSTHLHFGHLGVHEVVAGLMQLEGWSPESLGREGKGQREGWWGMSPSAEAFLDELVTWREVGHGVAAHMPRHDHYESLPTWAKATLAKHASDPRPHLYTEAQLEAGDTHDPIWNAAQRQLREEGRIHNYLRMLWGKKVLEWSPSPEAGFDTLMRLNDRWALDGRDPNSVSGVAWCFGRFDRAWGPERPIFGLIRYMSSENTARKWKLQGYLDRFGEGRQDRLF